MTNKDYETVVKEYEKLNMDRPDMYPLSFEEQIHRLNNLFSKENFIQAPEDKQIAIAIKWLGDGDALMKYYNALKQGDMELLNDVLYETAHILQIGNITSPGCDHGYYGMRITPNLLAAHMMHRIPLLLPKENGLSSGAYIGSHIANILMAIMYENETLRDSALSLSEKQLGKKNPKYCELYIKCMRAILQKNPTEFNEEIESFCAAFMKAKEFGLNGFNKRFCIEAHAMYNLAIWAFNGEMKDEIKMPNASNFCQELALWQKEHDYIQGKTVHIYPLQLDLYNRLMKCEPPRMYLRQDGKNRFIDTDGFLKNVIERMG